MTTSTRGQTGKSLDGRKRHRANSNARNWHQHGGFAVRLAQPKTSSWWIAGAGVNEFDAFTKLAHDRDNERQWSSVVPHAMNARNEFK